MRMAEAELITDLLIAILDGIQSKKVQINIINCMMKILKIGRK